MVYYNPHITGQYNPLYTINNQGFFHCSYHRVVFDLNTHSTGGLRDNFSNSHKETTISIIICKNSILFNNIYKNPFFVKQQGATFGRNFLTPPFFFFGFTAPLT